MNHPSLTTTRQSDIFYNHSRHNEWLILNYALKFQTSDVFAHIMSWFLGRQNTCNLPPKLLSHWRRRNMHPHPKDNTQIKTMLVRWNAPNICKNLIENTTLAQKNTFYAVGRFQFVTLILRTSTVTPGIGIRINWSVTDFSLILWSWQRPDKFHSTERHNSAVLCVIQHSVQIKLHALGSYGKKAKNLYLATFWIFHRPSSYTIFTDFHLFSPCACVTDKQRIDRSCMKLQIVVCKYVETARVFTNKTQTWRQILRKKV